jgi:hypothetical protein
VRPLRPARLCRHVCPTFASVMRCHQFVRIRSLLCYVDWDICGVPPSALKAHPGISRSIQCRYAHGRFRSSVRRLGDCPLHVSFAWLSTSDPVFQHFPSALIYSALCQTLFVLAQSSDGYCDCRRTVRIRSLSCCVNWCICGVPPSALKAHPGISRSIQYRYTHGRSRNSVRRLRDCPLHIAASVPSSCSVFPLLRAY